MNSKHKDNELSLPISLREPTDAIRDTARIMGGTRLRGTTLINTEPGRPLISVVTAVRNGRAHIEQTILSVLSQTYDNVEYIVIDGASTDGTLDIIKKYDDRIAYWISEPDHGIYDAMNKGIAAATGNLIGLLNSDDYYEQGAVESIVRAYRESGEERFSIIYGDYHIIDENLGIRTLFRSHERFWQGMSICHQAMFVTSYVYERIGLYDTNLRYAADYDFLVRSVMNKVNFIHVPLQMVTFRNSGATYNNVLRSNRESLAVLRWHFGILSKNYLYFLFYQVFRSLLVTGAKRTLTRLFKKQWVASFKLFYNRIARRESRDL